jgi:hypothetical protein
MYIVKLAATFPRVWNTSEAPDLIKHSISFHKTGSNIKTHRPCIISAATETVNQPNLSYEERYKQRNFKEFCFLGYNAVLPVESQLTFCRKMLLSHQD